jgi:3-oxoacyl-[acyl-carrier protein] reductase
VALLVQELARRLPGDDGRGVVAFTSDALTGNIPYGVGKGALDRITKAAALELASRGIRANCINQGPPRRAGFRRSYALRSPCGRRPICRPGTSERLAVQQTSYFPTETYERLIQLLKAGSLDFVHEQRG